MLNTPNSKVRIDILSAAGVKIAAGAITSAVEFSYTQEIDRIGSFTVSIPSVDPLCTELQQGRILNFYLKDEGLVFRGIIDIMTIEDEDGQSLHIVEGSSIARQLAWKLILTREFSGTAMNTAIDILLGSSGWSRGTTSSPATSLLQKIEAASVWKCLEDLALRFGYHIREDLLTNTIDVGAMGVSSGLLLTNLPAAMPVVTSTDLEVIPIAAVSIQDESTELWNSIVPWGAGEGVNRLTLQQSSRSSPYSITGTVGGDFQTHYYIQDAASVTAHGLRRKVVSFKDIQPIANTPAGHEAAANALYDVATTVLLREKDFQTVYGVAVTGMKHLNSVGSYRFQVGDKMRVRYNGVVKDLDGNNRAYRSIDQDLWLVSYTRTVTDEEDSWELDVATIDKLKVTGDEQVAQALEDLHSLKVSVKPYTYREVHGPERRSVDVGKTVTFIVDYDTNVTYLHQARLNVAVVPVRTNASGASSAPSTSSGASSATTSAASNTTSSGASSSTTTGASNSTSSGASSDTTTSADGLHRHQLWANDPDNTEYDLGLSTLGTNESTSHGHLETGGTTQGNSVPHTHNLKARGVEMNVTSNIGFPVTVPFYIVMDPPRADTANPPWTYDSGVAHDHENPHTHTIAHTHNMPHDHTIAHNHNIPHTHDISAHDHDLVFGIYEGSGPTAAANITLTINGVSRTVILGGPWDDDFLNVDITSFLVDSDGLPLQQRNTLVFGSGELLDLEIVVKSIVTAAALVPQ